MMRVDLRAINPRLHWQNQLAKQYLEERDGSKAGTYLFIEDECPALRPYLPPGGKYLAFGDDIEKFLDKIDFSKPKIVRACHPLDFLGMVDVVPTEVLISEHGRDDVRQAIQDIYTKSQNLDVKGFVEYEFGIPFDGEVGILVVDNCFCQKWTIVEHPHQKGIYRVSAQSQDCYASDIIEGVFDNAGKCLGKYTFSYDRYGEGHHSDMQFSEEGVTGGIALFEKLKDSGLVPSTESFQVEYGHAPFEGSPLFYYQTRLFKPYGDRANFEIDTYDTKNISTHEYNAFGVTSEEGIEIHFDYLGMPLLEEEPKAAYIVYRGERQRESTPLTVRPRNLEVFLPATNRVLGHGDYRWLQRAPVSLVGIADKLLDKAEPGEKKIRVISNGICGVVQIVE